MVEIFKTDVCCEERAKEILALLKTLFPEYILNFDLEDRDKILRAESGLVDIKNMLLALETNAVRAALID